MAWLKLTDDNSNESCKEVKHVFTQKDPNQIIAIAQTRGYGNNRGKLTCVSSTEYDQNNTHIGHNKVNSVHFFPDEGCIYRLGEPQLLIPDDLLGKLAPAKILRELSGLSKVDLMASMIFNRNATNKIISNLEDNSIRIDPSLKELTILLTNPDLLEVLASLSPDESDLVILAIYKMAYPETFGDVLNYYTKYHIACNRDNFPPNDDNFDL